MSGGLAGFGKESRDITISNGRAKIKELATGLHLNQHHEDFAVRLFTLAVQHNFVQGRKTENVCSACLYIVCRREKTPHLLIDFSDLLQTNVFPLGQTFLKLVRLLNITVPLIDPSLYIHRFASKLEFEELTHAVAMTAVRLVGRMSRDWLQTGRRPAGICGACLLIAARMHGFRRAQQDILRVVHVCDSTLRHRLEEFVKTPASALTQGEFESEEMDQIASQDPPAYQRAEADRKEKEIVLMIENGASPEAATKAVEDKAALAKGAKEAEEEDMTDELETLESEQTSGSGGRGRKRAAPGSGPAAAAARPAALMPPPPRPPPPPEVDLSGHLLDIAEVKRKIESDLDAAKLGKLCRQLQVTTSGRKKTRLERVVGLAASHPNLSRWAFARLLAGAPPPHPAIWRPQDKENDRPDLTSAGKLPPNADKGIPSATAAAAATAASTSASSASSSSSPSASSSSPSAGGSSSSPTSTGASGSPGASAASGASGTAAAAPAAGMSAAISRQIVRLPSPELGESDEDHLSDVDDDIDDYLIKDSKEVKVRTLPTYLPPPRDTYAGPCFAAVHLEEPLGLAVVVVLLGL